VRNTYKLIIQGAFHFTLPSSFMKVITWNLERLKRMKAPKAQEILLAYDADIYILTETHEALDLGNGFHGVSSKAVYPGHDGMMDYKVGECCTQIFTKYKILKQVKTFDAYNTIHLKVESPDGELSIYGGIIGVDGGTKKFFKRDLAGVLKDWSTLNKEENICLAGDFNTILQGHRWPSRDAVNSLLTAFKKLELTNLTLGVPMAVDHIVLSNSKVGKSNMKLETWNANKKLSDHIGVLVEFGAN
jgi:endonuclease/exonuclease/phosphatase family metal-dependent hydrolase